MGWPIQEKGRQFLLDNLIIGRIHYKNGKLKNGWAKTVKRPTFLGLSKNWAQTCTFFTLFCETSRLQKHLEPLHLFTATTETLLLVSFSLKVDYLNNRREFGTSEDRFEISTPISSTWANTYTFSKIWQTMLGPTLLLHITAYLSNHQDFFTSDFRFKIIRPISSIWSHAHTFWTRFQTFIKNMYQVS